MTNTAKVMDTAVADWAEGFRDRVAKVRKTVLGL